MAPPSGINNPIVQVFYSKPGAMRLRMNGRCVAPYDYAETLKVIEDKCPDVAGGAYLISGFETRYRDVGRTPVPYQVPLRCAQAEYYAPGKVNMDLNKQVLQCLNRSVVSRAVKDIPNGTLILRSLKIAVDESIPSHWERYSNYYFGAGASFFTALLFMFGVPWAQRRYFGGHHGDPLSGGAVEGQLRQPAKQSSGLVDAKGNPLASTDSSLSRAARSLRRTIAAPRHSLSWLNPRNWRRSTAASPLRRARRGRMRAAGIGGIVGLGLYMGYRYIWGRGKKKK